MSVRGTTATARRVLAQLKGDPRTIALLLFVPCLLMTLLYWVYADRPETFDRVGLQLLGIFPFITMFLVTSVAMLRERTSGTLERLLTTPIGKGDLLVGYALAFGVAAGSPRPRSRPGSRSACSASTPAARSRSCWSWPSPTRCSGWRSACSSPRSPRRSSRRCSSCPPSCSRRSCCAA